jgi:hypothetical protein
MIFHPASRFFSPAVPFIFLPAFNLDAFSFLWAKKATLRADKNEFPARGRISSTAI